MNNQLKHTFFAVAVALLGGTLARPVYAGVNCGGTVTGNVVLTQDLHCVNTGGLSIGADNTTIDLNGHTIYCDSGTTCGGQPYVAGGTSFAGIGDNGHHYVTVKGPGTISGFNVGINLSSQYATVTGVTVKSPSPGGGIGIWISQASCPLIPVRQGTPAFQVTENQVFDQRFAGISVVNAACGLVSNNVVAYNNSPLRGVWGITLGSVSNTTLSNNTVTQNGCGTAGGGGINMHGSSVSNHLTSNFVSINCGDGIEIRDTAAKNTMQTNTVRFNGQGTAGGFDMAQLGTGSNTWNTNNICVTQVGGIPAGACNPYE